MGNLCGGAHKISGIKAPFFLRGGWLEGSWWLDGCCWGGLWGGWCGGVLGSHDMGGIRCPHVFSDNLVKKMNKLSKNNIGASWGASDAPCDTPMLFFGNLVKKFDNLSL